MLHATFAEGTPPHFLKGEIVDTVLQTNQTLSKARKHAFFLKKWEGLILISLPLIVVSGTYLPIEMLSTPSWLYRDICALRNNSH